MRLVILNTDIWRCAALMIANYGDVANIEAASEADVMLAKGDIDGQRVWMRIAKAIEELRMVNPGERKQ